MFIFFLYDFLVIVLFFLDEVGILLDWVKVVKYNLRRDKIRGLGWGGRLRGFMLRFCFVVVLSLICYIDIVCNFLNGNIFNVYL